MARKQVKSRPGLFGMVYYYDESGNLIGKSRLGLVEGTRVYTDQNGEYAGKSRPGFFAKEVFTSDDHNHIASYDSICGEIHFENGVPIGHTRPGLFGTSYTCMETEEQIQEDESYQYEADDVGEIEKRRYYENCQECDPKITRYAFLKKLAFFVLSLVICALVAHIIRG